MTVDVQSTRFCDRCGAPFNGRGVCLEGHPSMRLCARCGAPLDERGFCLEGHPVAIHYCARCGAPLDDLGICLEGHFGAVAAGPLRAPVEPEPEAETNAEALAAEAVAHASAVAKAQFARAADVFDRVSSQARATHIEVPPRFVAPAIVGCVVVVLTIATFLVARQLTSGPQAAEVPTQIPAAPAQAPTLAPATAAQAPTAAVPGTLLPAAPLLAPTQPPAPTPTAIPTAQPKAPPRPTLGQHVLNPTTARPGDKLTLSYLITNPASSAMQAVLQAKLFQRPSNAELDDSQDELTVTLAPGSQIYQRVFQLPAAATPGAYDVTWTLVSTDGSVMYAQVTDTGGLTLQAPAPTPAPTSTPVPATQIPTATAVAAAAPAVPVQVAADPADAVRTFYSLIDHQAYRAAWDLLGPHFQANNTYAGWVKGYATTQSVAVPSATTLSQSGSSATIKFTIVAVDRQAGGQLLTQTFAGTWDLVLIDGEWKLDVAHVSKIS